MYYKGSLLFIPVKLLYPTLSAPRKSFSLSATLKLCFDHVRQYVSSVPSEFLILYRAIFRMSVEFFFITYLIFVSLVTANKLPPLPFLVLNQIIFLLLAHFLASSYYFPVTYLITFILKLFSISLIR